MSKTIPLTQGKVTIVDNEDYEWLNQWKWCASANRAKHGIFYAKKTTKPSTYMHRIILGIGADQQVDHINYDGLDNRRANLRACTQEQNLQHARSITPHSSKYKGVSWHKAGRKWRATIMVNKEYIHLGFFVNEKAAAKAYDKAAQKHFRDFASTNETTRAYHAQT